ncbi:MAG: CocE/NonD family hydrolase [Actinomycetota bacterium]
MRRFSLLLSLALCIAAVPGSSRAQEWTPRPATYGSYLERDVRITMSDGARLSADVYHPADLDTGNPAAGLFPVLLTQTPYNKNGLNWLAPYLVTRGYIQVVTEVRGTGSSEGTWEGMGAREQLDSKELVEWAASQPWSNGRVGLHGRSYGAVNQFFTAAQHPKGLKALFPVAPMADWYRDFAYTGGEQNTSFHPAWLAAVTALGLAPGTYATSDPAGAGSTMLQHAGGALSFQASSFARGPAGNDTISYDGPFYRQRSPIEFVDRVDVPTFVVGGWFDLFQRGEPMLYDALQARGVPARLLMGPWYHLDATSGTGLPADDVPTLDELELRWMDRYVREDADPDLDADVAPITYYRLGDGHYHTSAQWPPDGVRFEQRFLGGAAVAGVQHGTLQMQAPETSDPDTLIWQPASGPCSRSISQWSGGGLRQSCEEDNRANTLGGLTYDLPLDQNTTIAGPLAARLFVSTNDRDAFVTARVEDVAPDGKATQLTAGWSILSMRAMDSTKTRTADGLIVQPYHPFTKESVLPVAAGEVNELWVEIFPTAALLRQGHSLRLSLQPSDAPHLSPSVPLAANMVGSVLSLHHDTAFPSSLVIPFQR